jgi:hypothetical protein
LKFLIKTSIFFLILFLIAFFSANYVLKKLAVKALSEFKPRLEQKGIIIENFNYNNIVLNSYNSCAITNIDLDFHLNRKMYDTNSFKAKFNAKSITIRFADFNDPSFFFTFKDFSLFVEPEKKSTKKPFGKLENGYLKSRIPLHLNYPEESAKEILAEVKILFRENRTPIDLEIEVDALLGIDEKEVKVGLYTQRIDAVTYLKFDEEDILNAAKNLDLILAKKEAEIISNHPSRVPALIKITRDAKRLSEAEKNKDASFPDDAYKHIYWSYQLAREFGPDLAKEITDAHETIPNNTANERIMDYHNNEVGRKYATEKLSSHELKNRVLHSEEIIRSPNEVW